MRLKNKEITEFDKIIDVMKTCEICRVAIMDVKYPYIVPMNFGMQVIEDKIFLYFHTATEGRKIDLLRKNGNVAFEMESRHEIYVNETNTMCSCAYASVMGEGNMIEIAKEDKKAAMQYLLSQYAKHQNVQYNEKVLDMVLMWKLEVSSISAKQNIKK